ncbi:MAG: hypothetical protein QXF26_05315 [Candidatus Bathyarchaeia archaeon]
MARTSIEIDELTGNLSLYMSVRESYRSTDDYTSLFISWLSKRTRCLRTDAGKYIFEGGVLSVLGAPSTEGVLVRISFSFRDATLTFLDELFVAATNEYATCTMYVSMKFGGDISRIREFVKGNSRDFSETEMGNFSGSFSLHGQVVRVNAYPSVNRFTLECTLNRWSGVPSSLIRSILAGKSPTTILRRLLGR